MNGVQEVVGLPADGGFESHRPDQIQNPPFHRDYSLENLLVKKSSARSGGLDKTSSSIEQAPGGDFLTDI